MCARTCLPCMIPHPVPPVHQGRTPSLHKAGEEMSSALESPPPPVWAWPNCPGAMSSTHKLISHDSQYNHSCCNSWYDSQHCASRIHHLKSEENCEGLIGCVDCRASPRDLLSVEQKAPTSQLQMSQPRRVVDFLFAETPDVCFKIHSSPNVQAGELVRWTVSRK